MHSIGSTKPATGEKQMGSMHEHLDQRRLADLAADPDFKPANAAEAVDAAIVHLNNLLAKRAVEDNAERAALDVSRRAAFEAIHVDAKPARVAPMKQNDGFTSLQPLGDAEVMVCFSFDGDELSIDGADLPSGHVPIECFTAAMHTQWYRAIDAEQRKESEIDREAAMAGSEE